MKIKSNGCIYQEYYNPGNNKPRKQRYVAELKYHGKRFRFRSTNPMNVDAWLQDMKAKIADGKLKVRVKPRKHKPRKARKSITKIAKEMEIPEIFPNYEMTKDAAMEKNAKLVASLRNYRTTFCGIGTRKTKLLLNRLVQQGVPFADLWRTALEAEDANITAKRYSRYQERAYKHKRDCLRELARLFQKYGLVFGIQPTENFSTKYILYFELPTGEQISFHTNDFISMWPLYEKPWDGERLSTMRKLNKGIKAFLEEHGMLESGEKS